MASKVDIVNGAYQVIRISGLTVKAGPEEIVLALQVLDDYMAELSATLDTGYIQPEEYGMSDPNDFSGLVGGVIGPVKKLLAAELLTYFGKEIPMTMVSIVDSGMRSLEQQLVNVQDMQNPGTLPLGSGNEWDYRSDKFYPEPNNDDGAENHFETDVFQLPINWDSWVGEDETLVGVTYDPDSGLVLTNEAIIDNTSVVTISFNQRGQFTLCVVAEKSNGDKRTERFVYNSMQCRQQSIYYP